MADRTFAMLSSKRWPTGCLLVLLAACARPASISTPIEENSGPGGAQHRTEEAGSYDSSGQAAAAHSQSEAAAESDSDTGVNEISDRAVGPPRFALLEVPGFGDAVVSIPGDLSEPRPLFVVTHGAGGGPDWHCATWQEIVQNQSFVLCPRGDAIDRRDERQGYYYKNHLALEQETLAAVEALRQQFETALDLDRAVYAGYSQGATMGSLMIIRHGKPFSRLVLIEGGFSEWNVAAARTFKQSGGERVLFACGTRHCYTKAARSAAHLDRAGVNTQVEHAAGAGHTPAGAVRERFESALPWLLEGDARFEW